MASSIDPSKPADGMPTRKADLRANLQAARSEIEALQSSASHVLKVDTRTASHAYAAADFDANPDNRPLYILADPSAGPITLTFPDPADFGLAADEARVVAQVRAANGANDVAIACANPARLRSQPGTPGWDATTSPVKLGATLAQAGEATVTVTAEGARGLLILDGALRA